MWPFERKPKITPGSRTVPGYAGPCGVSTQDPVPATDPWLFQDYIEGEFEKINRKYDNIERRARYRKTMRSRRPAVR